MACCVRRSSHSGLARLPTSSSASSTDWLGGLTGLGGIVSTISCQFRGWPKDKQRAVFQPVLFAAFVIIAVSQFVAGSYTAETVRLYGIGLPFMAAGIWIGFKLYGAIDDETFRKTVLVLVPPGRRLVDRCGNDMTKKASLTSYGPEAVARRARPRIPPVRHSLKGECCKRAGTTEAAEVIHGADTAGPPANGRRRSLPRQIDRSSGRGHNRSPPKDDRGWAGERRGLGHFGENGARQHPARHEFVKKANRVISAPHDEGRDTPSRDHSRAGCPMLFRCEISCGAGHAGGRHAEGLEDQQAQRHVDAETRHRFDLLSNEQVADV